MGKEARFDEEVLEAAKAFSEELIKHKEVRSVAVMIDWELPPAAGAAMPAGVWLPQDKVDIFVGTTGMQVQLHRMSNHFGRLLMDGIEQMHAAVRPQDQTQAADKTHVE